MSIIPPHPTIWSRVDARLQHADELRVVDTRRVEPVRCLQVLADTD